MSPETTFQSITSDSDQPISYSSSFVMKDLGPNDVLLGRGTGPNEQIGNIRFRALVRDVIHASGKRGLDGKEKTRLAKSVIQEVKAKGGRFVRKVEGGGADVHKNNATKVGDHYEEVSDALALDKTKQSFRHQLRGTRGSTPGGGASPARPGTLPTTTTTKNKYHAQKEHQRGGKPEPPKKIVQDLSQENDRHRIPRSIVLQERSSSVSSGGTSASSPPGQTSSSTTARSTATSTFLTEGLLKLKSLQHERTDMFCAGPPSGSFVDPYLISGLRNSLLTYACNSELMRKEILASRYLLAEAILLGGGLGRPGEGGLLSSSSPPYVLSAATRMHHTVGDAIRSHHNQLSLSVSGTPSQQRGCRMDSSSTLPVIFENDASSRVIPTRSPHSFQHHHADDATRP